MVDSNTLVACGPNNIYKQSSVRNMTVVNNTIRS